VSNRKNEAGRIAAIRATYAAKKRQPRAQRAVVAWPEPPRNRIGVRCEITASVDQIAAMGPERARAFMAGVALVITAQSSAP
jgi:hypothetical protein